MPEIAAAWRHANVQVHGNPVDPSRLERLTRETRTGRYLAQGMSFRRALELASSRRNPREPDNGKERRFPLTRLDKQEIANAAERKRALERRSQFRLIKGGRNPRSNWTPILALGAIAGFFYWRQRGGASSTSTVATMSAAPAATPMQLPQPPPLIPYATWWSKYVNHGQGVPITSQFPDIYVYDTPDGGMVGVPIPPPIQ
jgi:hypothetical protein